MIGVSLYGAWSQSIYRLLSGAALTLLMVAAGSSATGLRRSATIPAAMVLLISAASRRASHSLRLAAPAIGIGLGLVFGALVTGKFNHAFAESARMYGAQWDVISDSVPWRMGSPLAFVLFVVSAVLLMASPLCRGSCCSYATSCCTHARRRLDDDALSTLARVRSCSEHCRGGSRFGPRRLGVPARTSRHNHAGLRNWSE